MSIKIKKQKIEKPKIDLLLDIAVNKIIGQRFL